MTSEEIIRSPRLIALREQLRAGVVSALAAFWQEIEARGTPLVEPVAGDPSRVWVTFLWRGDPTTKSVLVVSSLGGVDQARDQMKPLADTDVWYITYQAPIDLRSFYILSPNDPMLDPELAPTVQNPTANWRRDPLNRFPFVVPRGMMSEDQDPDKEVAPTSSFALPAAPPQPWIAPRPGVPSGRVTMRRVVSEKLGNERRVWIYLPPGFDAAGEPYAVFVGFDGRALLKSIPMPAILDNLQAIGHARPLVGIFVDSLNRDDRLRELMCYPPFLDFLTAELMPWAREQFNVTSDPARTIVSGASAGGLTSAFAALRRPDVFGNVIAQSGYFEMRPDDASDYGWIVRQYEESPRLPVRFALDVGTLEDAPAEDGAPSLLAANRQFRDVLRAKGYSFDYLEYPGGHDYLCWRGSIGDHVLALARAMR